MIATPLDPEDIPDEVLSFICRDDSQNAANYEQIGRVLYKFSGDALDDVQQFARRLLVNILLANFASRSLICFAFH